MVDLMAPKISFGIRIKPKQKFEAASQGLLKSLYGYSNKPYRLPI